MIQIHVLWIAGYFLAYSVLTGAWNVLLLKMVAKKREEISDENGYVHAANAEMKYAYAVMHGWLMRVSQNTILSPLCNVVAMIAWPVYLPILIISAIYYLKKYYKVDGDFEDSEEDAA